MSGAVIKTESLIKRFGGFTAADAISFEVQAGDIFGFLGANGAGKTTAMRMLCGLSALSSGKATVGGYDVYREAERIKRHIGYMSQKFSLYEDLAVTENIRFYAGIYGLGDRQIKEESARLLQRLSMQGEAKKLVGALSLAWKQKLAFSVSVIHGPKIVFLDSLPAA